ncbi:ChbG/HpnK family deacetylase [Psychrobacter sp. AOP22-C1-C5]|uniref:ChbG/HpnK family deacetylase n=1 Tax=Psychrobacter sp. AOP22-C1-C5 TaxID=3457716 RepID=UPI0040366D9F
MTTTTSQQHSSKTLDNARAVIINVDDLGLSSAVNDAVLQLAECGRIGASSYMVGGTITDSEIKALTQLNVDIGLHLDLTGVFPSPLRGSLKSIVVASYLRQLNSAQVNDVISQQLDAFEDCFGRAPVFVDGHQHIHQFPVIRQHLINEISTRYGKDTQKPISARVTTPLVHDIKSWIIYALGGNAWRRLCEDHHIATNDRFGGVYGFDATSQELGALWETWLQKAPRTSGLSPALHTQPFATEPLSTLNQHDNAMDSVPRPLPTYLSATLIMCHPAVPDNSWQDDIKQAREREYSWLMSNQFEQLLQQHNVKLVRWSDITASV